MRSTANSAQMVLPEPVGAPMNALSSELLSVEKTCVWIGLKCVKAGVLARRRDGQRRRSSSSVCGGDFSGRMRWRKETRSVVSAPSQLLETMRMSTAAAAGPRLGW